MRVTLDALSGVVDEAVSGARLVHVPKGDEDVVAEPRVRRQDEREEYGGDGEETPSPETRMLLETLPDPGCGMVAHDLHRISRHGPRLQVSWGPLSHEQWSRGCIADS